jgi:RNA polymerase sigma factor (sigma-70 family)
MGHTTTPLNKENSRALALYFAETQGAEPLSRLEEPAIVSAAKRGDRAAIDRLIRSNQGWVVTLAKRYAKGRHAMSDLIQAGNEGLLYALTKFEQEQGNRFVTYAAWWVRSKMLATVKADTYPVRMDSGSVQKLLGKLKKVEGKLYAMYGYVTDEDVANATDISIDIVRRVRPMAYPSLSLESRSTKPNDALARAVPYVECVWNGRESQETVCTRDQIITMVRETAERELTKPYYNDRHRLVFRRRLFAVDEPATLIELGKEMGVSRERVRQLETYVKNGIRRALVRRFGTGKVPESIGMGAIITDGRHSVLMPTDRGLL